MNIDQGCWSDHEGDLNGSVLLLDSWKFTSFLRQNVKEQEKEALNFASKNVEPFSTEKL